MYDKTVRRRRAVLLLLVVSCLILLTAYFGESAGGGLHSVQRGVVTIVSPVQEGASRALKPFRDLFGWVGDTFDAKGDLKDARKEAASWRERAVNAEAAGRENAQLRGLLNLDRELSLADYGPTTARITGQSPNVWYRQIDIDKGTSAGVDVDMAVVASDGESRAGLIGKVSFAAPNAAKVRLMTDASMAVGAMILNGGKGIVRPRPGDPNDLILSEVAGTVKPGDLVVTSGTLSARDDLTSPYPPNLPIGTVSRVDGAGTDSQEVHVNPFVDLRNIDFAQVLTKRADGNR